MNIFVLSTGRCGSTTFAVASKHITNYSSAHESRAGKLNGGRLNYPANHIEVDNRLSWFLGSLDKIYGNRAFYVHLIREREKVAHSYAKRYNYGIIEAYRKRIFIGLPPHQSSPLNVCRHYYNTVNANIELFLKDKDQQLTVRLDSAKEGFDDFWSQIGAEGDKAAALREWQRQYNASP